MRSVAEPSFVLPQPQMQRSYKHPKKHLQNIHARDLWHGLSLGEVNGKQLHHNPSSGQ